MEYDWEKKIRPAEWELFFYNMPDWLLPKGVYVAGVVLAHEENVEGAFIPVPSFKPETIAEADIAKDAMGDLDRFRMEALQ